MLSIPIFFNTKKFNNIFIFIFLNNERASAANFLGTKLDKRLTFRKYLNTTGMQEVNRQL